MNSSRSDGLEKRDYSSERLVEALSELISRLGHLFKEMEDGDPSPPEKD